MTTIARRVLNMIPHFNEVFDKNSDYRCWISPHGEVIEVKDHHFETIQRSPDRFGFSAEEVGSFSRHGQEGSSREDLVRAAVNKGWIRVRYYQKKQSWSVNINKPSQKIADILTTFFERRYSDSPKSYPDINIDSNLGVMRVSLSDILRLQLFKMMERKKKVLDIPSTL